MLYIRRSKAFNLIRDHELSSQRPASSASAYRQSTNETWSALTLYASISSSVRQSRATHVVFTPFSHGITERYILRSYQRLPYLNELLSFGHIPQHFVCYRRMLRLALAFRGQPSRALSRSSMICSSANWSIRHQDWRFKTSLQSMFHVFFFDLRSCIRQHGSTKSPDTREPSTKLDWLVSPRSASPTIA